MPATIALWLLAALILSGAEVPGIVSQFHVRVPMRDGAGLCTNVFLPAANWRGPVLLVRTPYGKGAVLNPIYRPFLDHGYALVVQDVRGRYDSEGIFKPLEQEANDGYDTLNWIGHQRWSNGRIGMVGGSYAGIVQWKVAVLNNPYLKAIFPVVSGCDDYRDRFYSTGGAFKLGSRLLWMSENLKVPGFIPQFRQFIWHLPIRTADVAATGQRSEMFQKAVSHPAFDSFWQSLSVREKLKRIRVPVFSIGGWYDNFCQSDLDAFAGLKNAPHRTLIGPWPHNMSLPFEGVDFGEHSTQPIRTLQLEWFDYWLKSDHPARAGPPGARLTLFVMGTNVWIKESAWPPDGISVTPYYLASKRGANSLYGDGELLSSPSAESTPDRFVYDPNKPVPTAGGAVCCRPSVFPWGPMDQRPVEKRKDVLVYTSSRLSQDVEVIGHVRVRLYVSSSAPDTDFTAKLVDVFPDGEARNLCDGILRLRYRNSVTKPAGRLNPREVYPVLIDAGVTANVFKSGHRIRLEISSSNFPRFDRNLNAGGSSIDGKQVRTANQTVYHGRQYASHLLLPVRRR
ncbi:MAG: CocE/NonD family hydrolase [Bryobacterales bacterium]|nr:CocE/NonD family hydrolase [Bryobacterales bacterium]